MKDQQKENLFRAVGEVGIDLVDMAEKRTFASRHWRRWGSIAAGLAVVVCLTALALPYFPKGCGASDATGSAAYDLAAGDANETVMESRASDTAEEPCAAAEPEEAEGAGTEEADMAENDEFSGSAKNGAAVQFLVEDAVYVLQPDSVLPLDTPPEDLGAVLGVVTEADWETLLTCTVYEGGDETVYVKTANGYYMASAVSGE